VHLLALFHKFKQILHFKHTQCICVFCVDLRKKQRLFPYRALKDWFCIEKQCCGLLLWFACWNSGRLAKSVCIRQVLCPANYIKNFSRFYSKFWVGIQNRIALHGSCAFLRKEPHQTTTMIPNVQACNTVWSSVNVPNLRLTVIYVYQTTRCQIIEDDNLRSHYLRISNLSTVTVNSDCQQWLLTVTVGIDSRQRLFARTVNPVCQQRLSIAIVSNVCQQRLSAVTVNSDCQQRLSAVSVNSDCQQRLSAVSVNSDCQQRLSAVTVNSDCQQPLSAVYVNSDCQQRLPAVYVNSDYQQRLSAVSVSSDCQQQLSAVSVNSDCQRRFSAVTVSSDCQ